MSVHKEENLFKTVEINKTDKELEIIIGLLTSIVIVVCSIIIHYSIEQENYRKSFKYDIEYETEKFNNHYYTNEYTIIGDCVKTPQKTFCGTYSITKQ